MTLPLPLRLPVAGSLLGLHLIAGAATANPPAVSFDTTPRAGQHQQQTLDIAATIRMRMEPGPDATEEQRAKIAQAAAGISKNGPLKMKMRMLQTLKVDAADATGWLPMTVSMVPQGGSMEVGGNTVPMPENKAGNISIAARFNPNDFSYELQRVDGGAANFNEAMAKQGQLMVGEALQLYKELAKRPLKVGESVEVPLNMKLPIPLPGSAGDMQSKLRYTLNRVDKGVAHFDVSMDLKMNMDVPMPRPPVAAASAPATDAAASAASAVAAEPAPAAPAVLHIATTGSGKGTSALRLSDRLPLHNELSMTMQMDMSGPDNTRMLMDMDMDLQSKGESLAKPAVKPKKKP